MKVKNGGARRKLIAALGSATYLLWLFSWLWVCLLYIDRFFQTPLGKVIMPDSSPTDTAVTPDFATSGVTLPMPMLALVAIIGGGLLIAATVYIIAKVYVPTVEKVAHTAVRKTAIVVTERAVKQHVIPAKKRRIFTARVTFLIKMTMSLLPVVIVFALSVSTPLVPREIAKAGALILAACAVLAVIAQTFFIHHWRLYETELSSEQCTHQR